ncbi:tetratricopeptide repeat protein [Brasilonema sp. CT11]|nr:tetratricopeptide repeat protein [Brasilonema sp. CT11]
MFDSDDFDIETYLANEEKREQIEQLHQLGNDCKDELQYAKAEKFYQRAAELAESIHDLSLMLKERFWLAAMQRMQGKYQTALGICIWLIEVAYNPELSRELSEDDLWYVAGGFMDFVEVGRCLPDMKAVELERVIDRGLDWLSSIGKRNWSAGLRLNRSTLWQNQGRKEAALAEMEAGLALCRRHSDAPGYTLSTHLLNLGDLLSEMEKLEDAESYYRQVAEDYEFHIGERRRAWKGLAYVALKREDFAAAETYALKSLEMARSIESPSPILHTYELLGDIFWEQRQIAEATEARIQAWRYARHIIMEDALLEVYEGIAKIRIYQARQGNPQHYIHKARQWLRWALPLAVRLDRQVGLTQKQEKIRQMQAECDEILAKEQPFGR